MHMNKYEDEDLLPVFGMEIKTIRTHILDLRRKRWTEYYIKIHIHMLYDIDQEKVEKIMEGM